MKSKDLNYYLALPHPIELIPIHHSDNEFFINARKFWKLAGWEASKE